MEDIQYQVTFFKPTIKNVSLLILVLNEQQQYMQL